MSVNIVVVQGLPITCNPMKIRLRFEAECQVRIKDIKVEPESATIKFASAEDCEKFRQNLPSSIKFGDDEHTLKIVDQNGSKKAASASASTVSDMQNEKISQRTDIIQTWSSLEKLPACESGIIVQPTSHSVTYEDLWKYFEDNKESCGGSIATMFPMIDGIFIAFKDENVAEKVWNLRPHRIKGEPVAVFLKHVPPPYKYKLVIKIPDENMNEENLKHLLQGCSSTNISPKAVKTFPSGAFLAVYDRDVDEKDVCAVMEEFRKKNPSFTISFLLMTDCLEIKPVPMDISENELRTLFQNKERTGGGSVTRIDLLEDSSILIYFASYKDAEAVVQKFAGKKLPVFGTAMKIRLYSHNLHVVRSNFKKSSPIDDYYAALFPGKDQHEGEKPSSFFYKEVDPDLLQFFIKNSEHVQMLNSQLEGMARVKMTLKGIKINQESNSTEKSSVMRAVQHFMNDYIRMKCKVPDDDVARRNVEMKTSGKSSSTEDLYLRWTNSQKLELVVAGLKVEVESFVKSLQPFLKDNNFLNLKEDQIRWLIETEVLDQLKKDYPAIGKQNKKGIELIGSENQTKAARHAIMELLNKLYQARFDSQGKDFVEFLLEAARNDKVAANVAELLKEQKMCAILVVKNGSPYIIGPQECCTTALAIVNSALATDESLEMASTEPDKQGPAWKIIRTLESEGKIRITMKEGSIVSIVGFHQHVTEAKEKLSQCNIRFRKIIKIENGDIQHINAYSDFKKICSKNSVLQEKIEDSVLLRGKMKEVEMVAALLQNLQETIVKKTQLIETFGIKKFLETKDGRDTLSKTGGKYRSTILFRPKLRQNIPLHGEGRDTPTMSQKASIPEKSSAMIGPLKVSIRQGDITDETNDAIVNSIGLNFDLSQGMLSQAIRRKGGDSIERELRYKHENDIRVTSNGKLNCKKIFHVAFPVSSREIIQCFVKLLQEADRRKTTSISIPAVHTGVGNLGADSLARLMIRSFREFVREVRQIKHLKIVDIVLFEDQQLQHFKTELATATADSSAPTISSQPMTQQRSYSSVTKHSTNANQQSLKIGNITVSVRQGDITEEENHAIINSTGASFDLSKGMVSHQILEKGGYGVQREVLSVPGKDIRVTDAGKLKCHKIIHVVAPSELSDFGDCLVGILKTAEERLCSTISVPAIGTGNLRLPVGQVAKILIKAIRVFVSKNPGMKYLRKVDFVIFHKNQVKEFRDAAFESTEGGYDNSPQQRAEGAAAGEANAPDSDCVELWVLSLENDQADKALDSIKEKIHEALCSVIIDDAVNKLTEREKVLMRECEKKFSVRISRSDGQISIEGLKNNRFQADQELRSILKDFARQPSGPSYHVWEYRDAMWAWQAFGMLDCQRLEEEYQKYLRNPKSYLVPMAVNSMMRFVNLKDKKIDAYIDIRRTYQPVASHGQNQTLTSVAHGQSGAPNGRGRHLSASSTSSKKRD